MKGASFVAVAGFVAVLWTTAGTLVRTAPDPIAPVSGPSQLHRLGLRVSESSMGSSGLWGTSPPVVTTVSAIVRPAVAQGVAISGADIYRFNCRACHRADGAGSPPEIHAIFDPVRAMSPAVMLERMRAKGTPITVAFARELAQGSREDMLDRLQHGGDSMPPMAHLQNDEIAALLSYLEVLAGVPGAAAREAPVVVPGLRVGEEIVRGTCHTCHDAAGSWPGPEALMEGAVPSLASITRQRSVAAVIQKVRNGAPVTMGALGLTYRGRMPQFGYLSEAEVAAAYGYLLRYPPQQ